ncbi:MAG: BrnT family toxin [Chloroflexia bacterium]|nr:BrnT family toxin [Chloroflexia bacterium]
MPFVVVQRFTTGGDQGTHRPRCHTLDSPSSWRISDGHQRRPAREHGAASQLIVAPGTEGQGVVVRFEWDIGKDRVHRGKHGVGFNAAEQVFDDPLAITVEDRVVDGEQRWRTTGVDFGQFLVVAIHVDRDRHGIETIRIISARKADSHERKTYESGS